MHTPRRNPARATHANGIIAEPKAAEPNSSVESGAFEARPDVWDTWEAMDAVQRRETVLGQYPIT
jgi:hypothetical protein